MPIRSPLTVWVVAPVAGRTPVALSTDPRDCALVLSRLAARKRRDARTGLYDPATRAVVLAEAERLERLLAILAGDSDPGPRAA